MIANIVSKDNIQAVRSALKALGLVVAEIDRDLRYVWIDNPHPDFDVRAVLGKRDDELIPLEEAAGIMSLKRAVIASGLPVTRVVEFRRSDGVRRYHISGVPIVENGRVTGAITAAVDAPW